VRPGEFAQTSARIRRGLARSIAIIASLVFLILSIRELQRRGGPVRARTLVSHSGFASADSEAAIVLAQRARKVIPRGAVVTTIDGRPNGNDGLVGTVAQGQMPQHRVVTERRNALTAQYVVALRDHFEDPRYAVIWSGAEGTILRRRR
jgi:hypothetical protein